MNAMTQSRANNNSFVHKQLSVCVFVRVNLCLCACECVASLLSEFDVASLIMTKIVFITFNSSLVPLIESQCSPNPWEFEFSDFRRNRTDDLGINSPSL